MTSDQKDFQPRDIVYSFRRKSTFILQSRERNGTQWYCNLVDPNTHEVIRQEKHGCLQTIDCYAWEYDFVLVKRQTGNF